MSRARSILCVKLGIRLCIVNCVARRNSQSRCSTGAFYDLQPRQNRGITLQCLTQIPIVISRALSAIVLTAGGTYLALQPRDPASHDDHHSSDHESHEDSDESESVAEKASDLKDAAVNKASDLKDAVSDKKDEAKDTASDKKEEVKQKLGEEKEAHKAKVAAITKSLIKGERSGDSVKNHGIASEKNEHKIREGKFCDEEFDNHITVHSADPGKDFERIKKEKAKARAE